VLDGLSIEALDRLARMPGLRGVDADQPDRLSTADLDGVAVDDPGDADHVAGWQSRSGARGRPSFVDRRVWAGRTMAEAAGAACLPRSTWEKTERGQRPLSRERAERMARTLDVEPEVVEAGYERARRRRLVSSEGSAQQP
jgi:hypothetical protein